MRMSHTGAAGAAFLGVAGTAGDGGSDRAGGNSVADGVASIMGASAFGDDTNET